MRNDDTKLIRQSQEREKLTLRKNYIFDKLFEKRKIQYSKEDKITDKYKINISSICQNDEINKNPELYIKTKFDIKDWFKYLFSKNIMEIKQALFLIELFVKLQTDEIPYESRALSRNNYELINCICHYLNHTDKQIAYYACRITVNLLNFPMHIHNLVLSNKNLKEIISFIKNNDFDIGYEIICLMINCCTFKNIRQIFVNNKIIERINFLITNCLDKLESKFYIYLIRLLCIIIKLFRECDDYPIEQINNWFRPLLGFYKNCLKNYVNNPFSQKNESYYYYELLFFYIILSKGDSKFIYEIIDKGYIQILIDFYYKLEEKNLGEMMKLFNDLLSIEDSINQLFIKEGILDLLINEINRIEYKNDYLLSLIFCVCSNIACGTQGQIEELFSQGILWKVMDIPSFYISKNIFTKDINKVIHNAIYTLNEAILGGGSNLKVELMIYQEFLIVYLYYFYLKNYLDKKNEIQILEQIGKAINKLINCGESEFDQDILNKFRNKLISVGMEDLISNLLIIYNEKNIQFNFKMILQFLQEEEN